MQTFKTNTHSIGLLLCRLTCKSDKFVENDSAKLIETSKELIEYNFCLVQVFNVFPMDQDGRESGGGG